MATEEQKNANRVRLSNLALLSLAAGVWDILGNGVNAFSGPMGDAILEVMEKEMGLEVAGEDPETIMHEISRIFVDEYGFASEIEVVVQDPEHFQLRVKNCVNRAFTDKLVEAGVEKPFICPILNSCRSALRRMGHKMVGDVQQWKDGKGSIISFSQL
jgi:hypothetical protein